MAPFLSSMPLLPFLIHQLKGYQAFCLLQSSSDPDSERRPWCANRLPFIYPFVQSEYWDSGFLQYWKMQQLPNFVLAGPLLGLLLWGSGTFIVRVGVPVSLGVYHRVFSSPKSHPTPHSSKSKSKYSNPLLVRSLLPHAIYALILTLTLLFAAHTQIILRVAPSMPFTYWSAAWLVLEHPKWAKAWVTWSIVWGAMSVVLWVVFLPPA